MNSHPNQIRHTHSTVSQKVHQSKAGKQKKTKKATQKNTQTEPKRSQESTKKKKKETHFFELFVCACGVFFLQPIVLLFLITIRFRLHSDKISTR